MQRSIPFMQIRGGSSKGIYFNAADLPTDPAGLEQTLVAVIGGDSRQIDGLGGADPLTSKVGIVSLSAREDADIDYLFVQVVVGEQRIDTSPNCGNILAGVGAFALESRLLPIHEDITRVRVHMINSGKLCELVVQTPDGRVRYDGQARIDGVPGTAAPVLCNFLDIAGSACGSLYPTGQHIERINGIDVTCIDNGMPVVVLRSADLGKRGDETCAALEQDASFCERLEAIRLVAGERMKLGDVTDKVIPKMSLISRPVAGGHVNTRTFIPHRCHAAIGVLGAVSVATACIMPGTVAEGVVRPFDEAIGQVSVEHPSGEFSVTLTLDENRQVTSAGLLRTARLLSRGNLYVPEHRS